MATRRDTLQRKTSLKQNLRIGWQNGLFRPGDLAPSVRELAEQYNLSRPIVMQVVQELVQEGVLHTVTGTGTYFGQPMVTPGGFYLSVFQHPHQTNTHFAAVQAGFEEFIAKKGGSSLSLSYAEAEEYQRNAALPVLAGIFEVREAVDGPTFNADIFSTSTTPYVRFISEFAEDTSSHSIAFDNFDGGCQATQHLLQLGHKKIAFLGLHQQGTEIGFRYSIERERGWSATMKAAGLADEQLSFLPPYAVTWPWDRQTDAAQQASMALAGRSDVTAVVTVNSFVTKGFCEALKFCGVLNEQWPLIVSFDDEAHLDSHVISTMRLPWRNLGQQAAFLLWEWSQGKVPETRQHLLKMQMIPRLTSQPAWANGFNVAKIQSPPVLASPFGTISG